MDEEQAIQKVGRHLWKELPQADIKLPAEDIERRREILFDYVKENIRELLTAASIPVLRRNQYTAVHKGFLQLLFSLFNFKGTQSLIDLGNAINDDLNFNIYGLCQKGRGNKFRVALYDSRKKLKRGEDVFRTERGVVDYPYACELHDTYFVYVLDCYKRRADKNHEVHYPNGVFSFKNSSQTERSDDREVISIIQPSPQPLDNSSTQLFDYPTHPFETSPTQLLENSTQLPDHASTQLSEYSFQPYDSPSTHPFETSPIQSLENSTHLSEYPLTLSFEDTDYDSNTSQSFTSAADLIEYFDNPHRFPFEEY